AGEFDAIVTAPVHKQIINDAGVRFSGHTEFFAERTASPRVLMLLTTGELRVALATTHLPLRAVSDAITVDSLLEAGVILARGLRACGQRDAGTPDRAHLARPRHRARSRRQRSRGLSQFERRGPTREPSRGAAALMPRLPRAAAAAAVAAGRRPPRRKRFGQHFLHDPAVILRIARSLSPRVGDPLVDAGPGPGP